jgi:hypothetical protein
MDRIRLVCYSLKLILIHYQTKPLNFIRYTSQALEQIFVEAL